MMRAFLLAIGLTLAAGPGFANEAAPDAGPAAKSADKDKVVCRRERPTGSRIAEKVCMTKAQWEALSEASRESLDNATTGRASSNSGAATPGL